jgi:ribonuclease HI
MAAGVFVGEYSEYNKSVIVESVRTTNQVAELQAAIIALQVAHAIYKKERFGGKRLDLVVIKADSAYVVDGITDWVPNRWV